MLLKDLLGEKLISPLGVPVNLSEVEKYQYIGLYFSASWCNPCLHFSIFLKKFY